MKLELQLFLEQGEPLETFGVPSPELLPVKSALKQISKGLQISINKRPSTQFLSVQHHVSSRLYNHHLYREWVRKLELKKEYLNQLILTFDFRAPQFIMHPGSIQIGHNYGLGKVILDFYIPYVRQYNPLLIRNCS